MEKKGGEHMEPNDYLQNSIVSTEREFSRIARQNSERIAEQTQREKENNTEIKNISALIEAIEQSNSKNDKLSKRMFWLTLATAALAVIQVIVAIIQISRA